MNKSGLVDAASAKTGIGRRQVEEVIDSFLEAMTAAVERGETLTLKGFIRVERDARGATRARVGSRLGGRDAA